MKCVAAVAIRAVSETPLIFSGELGMNRMFKFSTAAFAIAVFVAFSMMTSSSANAQSCRGGGYYGGGINYGGGYYNSYRPAYGSYYGYNRGISVGVGGISVGVGGYYGNGVNLNVYRNPYTYRRPNYHRHNYGTYYSNPGRYHSHRHGHWHR